MKKYLFLLITLFLFSCKKENVNNSINTGSNKVENGVKYATGFDIQYENNYKVLTIKSPFPNAKESIKYVLVNDEHFEEISKRSIFEGMTVIKTPIKKMVVTSTTHIPMLELLHEENSLVGFPNAKYISSPKTRKLVDNGQIKELGKEQKINTELLLALNPEAVVGFSLSSNNKMFKNIEKFGINVILNGDWLEKSPLGRAEWIKFFGLLYEKEKLANRIFNTIEKQYNAVKHLAKQSKTKPKILSGVMNQDQWNLPAGDSYVAQFLNDANINYPWQDSKGTGSLSLSFETVFVEAKDAQIWISPGFFESYKQLKDANEHYAQFDAFKNKEIYNFTSRKGETGGILYYELALIQPHIVLKDLIKVFHPELLIGYEPFYLTKIE